MLIATFATIAEQPGIGRERLDLDRGLRSLPVGTYVIYYRETPAPVKIVRVLHGARDIGPLLGPVP